MARKGSRRGNGEGCIYHDKSKNRWEAKVTIGYNEKGKQRFKYFSAKTRKEVSDKLNRYIVERAKGTYIEPSNISLGDWLDQWYNMYVVGSLKEQTRSSYEMIIRRYLKPRLGHIKLKSLKGSQVQQHYMYLLESGKANNKGGLSRQTISLIHTVFNSALVQAMKSDYIIKNPMISVKLPRGRKKEIRVLTKEDQLLLEKECKNHSIGTAVIFALYTGVRLGELLALHWSDLDINAQTIRIDKQLSKLNNMNSDAEIKTYTIIQSTKTEKSKRIIYVAPKIIAKLMEHRIKQESMRNVLGDSYNARGLIFCSDKGEFYERATFRYRYKKLLKSAGIKETSIHALRHTFATRALEANIPIKVVSDTLGHSNIQTTLDKYSHVLPDLQRESMQKIADTYMISDEIAS